MVNMMTICKTPIIRPGISPPRNSRPTDSCATIAYRTIGTLGGMIIPIVEDATVIPLAKLAE